MHPEGVEIKGFRSIELVQLPLDGLTVLFGPNGVGKTNLLEAVAGALAAERHSLRDQSGERDAEPSSVALFLRTSLSLDEDRRWLLKVLRSRPEDVIPQDVLVTLATDLSRSEFGRQVDGSLVMLPESEDIAVVLESLALQLCAEAEDEDREVALRFTRALLVAPLVAVPVGSLSRIDLAARVGDPQVRIAAEEVCSKLPPHQWVTQSASRCLDGNSEFVTLFTLGWLRSDERKLPVDVLVLDAAPVGLEEEVEQAMPELFDRFWGVTEAADRGAAESLGWGSALADPWLERAGDGVQLRGAILPVLDLVERYAWANAPQFVTQQGDISVQARPVDEWYGSRRRIQVGFRFGHSESDLFALAALGAGLQRWVAASVREALRQVGNAQIRVWSVGQLDDAAEEPDERLHRLGELLDESLSLSEFQRLEYEGEIAPAPGLLLVDEPELHLHPKAQEDVARWLYDRSQQSRAVLAATHSATFLSYEPEHATAVRVYREADRTVTDVLGRDLLAALGDLDADVGLGRAGILQVLRGVVAVEGKHDELVIKHFFRADLAEQRLLVIPIHGAPNALSVAEGELFTRLGAPIRVILDQGDRERKLARLVDQRSTPGADVQEIIYEEPDVVCALPEAAVRRAFPNARFPGWDQLKRDHGGKFGFKGLALASMGLMGTKPTDFVTQVLRLVEPEERPSPALHRAVHQAFSSIADRRATVRDTSSKSA